MDKYQGKYRTSSTRLQNWDYGWNAAYFVTICTANRKCYFGEIQEGEMILSEVGKFVAEEWLKTPEIRPDMNLFLDAFVVMPNHFHAIIVIGENIYNKRDEKRRIAMHGDSTFDTTDTTNTIETTENTVNNKIKTPKNQFGPQRKNLGSVMRGFKSSVTTNARKIHTDFDWQPKFHDHIIRNNESYQRIRNYIINNAKNWNNDQFY
jgi:putative transposase